MCRHAWRYDGATAVTAMKVRTNLQRMVIQAFSRRGPGVVVCSTDSLCVTDSVLIISCVLPASGSVESARLRGVASCDTVVESEVRANPHIAAAHSTAARITVNRRRRVPHLRSCPSCPEISLQKRRPRHHIMDMHE